MTKKEIIAKYIADSNEKDLEKNLQYIYENRYRLIDKVPIKTFFGGLLELFKNNFKKDLGITLADIKEVVQNALEMSGIELEFVDDDWDNLTITTTGERWRTTTKNTDKNYMSEFYC